MNWKYIFIFTLVLSHTHVDTVQNVLQGLNNSSHICWSHTMKVLGWHVTFVRRSSVTVVTLRNMYVDMKVLSRMFAVTVQSVSVHQVNWNCISQYTRTWNDFAAVYAIKVLDMQGLLETTSRDVLIFNNILTDLWCCCSCVTLLSLWHCGCVDVQQWTKYTVCRQYLQSYFDRGLH